MTDNIQMPTDWWAAFWAGWFHACSGRADEEDAYELATEHYSANRHRPGNLVAAEVYARDPRPPLDGPPAKFIYPDDVPF